MSTTAFGKADQDALQEAKEPSAEDAAAKEARRQKDEEAERMKQLYAGVTIIDTSMAQASSGKPYLP